jgi:hypothetical protein
MNFFKVIAQGQTYLNILYLLLSYPLGILYFVFLVTGISLGFGLIITIIGIPILFGILLLWRVFGDFERKLTEIMLNIDIPCKKKKQPKRFWKKIEKILSDSYTWKSLVYLFIKFPIGIISFVLLTVCITVPLSLISTPFIFHLFKLGILNGNLGPFAFMQTYWFAILIGIIGIFLLFVSLHIFNGLAKVFGLLAKYMLERKR